MKKYLVLAGSALAGFGVFADGAAVIDTTALNSTITQIGTDLEGWVTTMLPIVGGIAGAFLVFWLFRLAIRIVKSFAHSK